MFMSCAVPLTKMESSGGTVLCSCHARLRVSVRDVRAPLRRAGPERLDRGGVPRVHLDRPAEAALDVRPHAGRRRHAGGRVGARAALRRLLRRRLRLPLRDGPVEPLADRVAACERCGLARTRRRAVPGDEMPGAALLLVAVAPSFAGELVGHALSDEAREVLEEAGVDVAATAATTLVKCRPPGGRAPTEEEIAACRPYLEEQIAA